MLLALLVAPSAAHTQFTLDDRFIELDGKREPGKIPDYLVWRDVFKFLAERAKGGQAWERILEDELQAQPKTVERFYKTAALATAEDSAAQSTIGATTRGLLAEKKSLEQIAGTTRPMELNRRTRTLEIADAFVASLGAEDQFVVGRWVDNLRASIKVTVLKSELAYFLRPR